MNSELVVETSWMMTPNSKALKDIANLDSYDPFPVDISLGSKVQESFDGLEVWSD